MLGALQIHADKLIEVTFSNGKVNPRRLKFGDMVVGSIRKLDHLSDWDLTQMFVTGRQASDCTGDPINLHHHKQRPEGPLYEVPNRFDDVNNRKMHPLGQKGGIGKKARIRHSRMRPKYWRARAAREILRRLGEL